MQAARSSSQQWPPAAMQQRHGYTSGQGYGNMPGSPSMQQWYDRINQQRGSPQRDRFPPKPTVRYILLLLAVLVYYLLNIY